MSKKLRLILLFIAVTVIFMLYFLILTITNSAKNQQQIAHTVYSSTGQISEIYIKSADIKIVLQNGKWVVQGEEDFPINEQYVISMVNVISPLYATAKITKDVQADTVYGFDGEYNVITVKDDETTTQLTIGDINAQTGDTYLKNNTTGEIFTVGSDFVSTYNIQKADLLQTDIWPITSSSQVQSVQFASDLLPLDGLKITIERTDDGENPVMYNVTPKSGQPFYAENDAANILISTISSLYITQSENYSAQQSEFASYGLEDPLLTMQVVATGYQGEDLSVTMHVGNVAPSGGYYVNFEGSLAINIMDGMFLEEIFNTNEQMLIG